MRDASDAMEAEKGWSRIATTEGKDKTRIPGDWGGIQQSRLLQHLMRGSK